MMLQAVNINPIWGRLKGCSSNCHESPQSSHQSTPKQLAIRSQADWQNDFRDLPSIQQSPQQKVMTEARRILLHKRQTDPSYAALPAFFGLDEHGAPTHAHFSKPSSQERGDVRNKDLAARIGELAVMHGVSTDALQELRHLLPDLPIHSPTKTELVRAMAADTSTTAYRLLQLKSWFPAANISIMVAHRPGLLLEEFTGIPAAKAVLQKWFDADAIDHMVQEQPLFLIEDVEDAISSLNRWQPTTNGAHKLQHNPSLLLSLVSNRKLSLW